MITYVDRTAAGNAIAQLHGKYVFPGSDCPMVVEWMDLKKQRPVGACLLHTILAAATKCALALVIVCLLTAAHVGANVPSAHR